MIFDTAGIWPQGPITGRSREIAGVGINFRLLPIRERFALGLEFSGTFTKFSKTIESFSNPEFVSMIDRLVALSDADEEFFDDDLTLQLPVALTAAEINFDGLFEFPQRKLLSASTHPAVKKAFKEARRNEIEQIAPTMKKDWFLFRPVVQDVCTYAEMFIDERFSFRDIHLMHEMLDFKQYSEIVANHIED